MMSNQELTEQEEDLKTKIQSLAFYLLRDATNIMTEKLIKKEIPSDDDLQGVFDDFNSLLEKVIIESREASLNQYKEQSRIDLILEIKKQNALIKRLIEEKGAL